MSHHYYLRHNANGRIQRKLDAHVAAYGEQNKGKIIARPSATGQGVHLRFDPERSLSPPQSQAVEPPRYASSTEYPIIVEHSDGEDSSSLVSDLITIIDPETPPRNHAVRASPPRAPGAPQLRRQRNWREGGPAASSGVVDSMASIANPRGLQYEVGRNDEQQRRMAVMQEQVEAALQRLPDQPRHGAVAAEQEERFLVGRFSVLRREYERTVEQFRQQNPDLFAPPHSDDNRRTPTDSPESSRPGNIPPEVSRAPSPQAADASHPEPRRRDEAEVSTQRQLQTNNADGTFVMVARRVPKLGPCGTLVLDHGTGEQMMETRRYRVRTDALHDIDEDGDSVMGSQ
ncbi:hypothetical protein BC827DRAFT_1269664 [Russula dissimulans]|nr:hypothetical protein BC827DRAFT_1269664 [Russula dissimulans]